jgi:hypothetical protein
MCFHCGKQTCLMNTSVGLKLDSSSIREGFNNYKLHLATPKTNGANDASVQIAPYIIHHLIIQSFARASTLVGFNIVTNVLGCVLVKIRQNFPNKIGFYKECRFNIRGDEQAPVELLLIKI